MVKARATENHGGVIISGTGEDLEELYCALNTLVEKHDADKDGEIPESATNLRISSLCYDIRRALPVPTRPVPKGSSDPGASYGPVGDGGKILSFETGKELPFDLSLDGDGVGGEDLDGPEELEDLEELEEFEGFEGFDEDYIDTGELDEAYDDPDAADDGNDAEELQELGDSDDANVATLDEAGFHYESGAQTGLPLQAICEFRILWPELIFVSLLLREYLGSRYDLEYSKTLKGLDWSLEWVTVRRFQIVVLDCLCLHVSPAQAKSIRKIFLESYSFMRGYCTQYVDKLTNTYAGKSAEQRLKLLPLLPKRIMAQGSDYRFLEAEIRKTASEYGCPPWELSLVEEIPEDFKW